MASFSMADPLLLRLVVSGMIPNRLRSGID
jgi:hypothetical protein